MHKFFLVLHVVAAVFLTGPLVLAPMRGLRALRQRDPHTLRNTGTTTNLYALLSLATFGFGVLTATRSDDYGLGTAWVTISMTLFVIALALTILVTGPALLGAAKTLTQYREAQKQTSPAPPATDTPEGEVSEPVEGREKPEERKPAVETPGFETPKVRSGTDGKLQDYRGRIAAASGTTAILLVLVTILMVTKPFD